jgi:hypothetical protein
MAATCVSKIGCGTVPAWCQTISISCRAAWNTFSGHQVEERFQVDACREGVDHGRFLRAGHLDHAEQGIIGRLTQEFGVDGDDRVLGEAVADGREFGGGGNQVHERSIALPKRAFCRKR